MTKSPLDRAVEYMEGQEDLGNGYQLKNSMIGAAIAWALIGILVKLEGVTYSGDHNTPDHIRVRDIEL
jgi:hypothetical protein